MNRPHRVKFVLALIGAFLLSTAPAGAAVWFVDVANCPGPGTGTADEPFCKIQDGINAASDGDIVFVDLGIYVENIDFSGKDVVVESVGGPVSTTIQGNLADRVVRFDSGEGPGARVDGFTITGGAGGIACTNTSPTIRNCIIAGNNTDVGAGINCFNSSPTVTDCIIKNNTASAIAGGIYCNANSSPTISFCTVSGNSATSAGGGFYCFNGSNPMISNCLISNNSTNGSGGGIQASTGSQPTIENCTISNNTATAGAGIDCYSSSPWITNSIIQDNIASEIAGGINCKNNASPTIDGCTVQNNEAILFNGGGMICNQNSNATITNTFFFNNSAVNGAGMYIFDGSSPLLYRCTVEGNIATGFGGGVVCMAGSDATIDRCILRANTAASGAGIGCTDSDPLISNCTIRGNTAADIGGGVLCDNSSPVITNCVVAYNGATFNGGGLYNYSAGSPMLINCTIYQNSAGNGAGMYSGNNSSPTIANSILWSDSPSEIANDATSITLVSYSDVEGGWAGIGNINANPLFVDGPGGDLHLSFGSPGIDAADNNAVPPAVTTDLQGNPRFVDDPDTADTGNPDGINAIVDMGAYEFAALPVCPNNCGDINGTGGNADLVDFANFALCFNKSAPGGACPLQVMFSCSDLDGNRLINLVDFATFSLVFGTTSTNIPPNCP